MPVAEVTTDNFRQEVLESSVPVVVDFYADWCGPCRQVSPALEGLSDEWGDALRFVKVDIETNREVADAYRISTIPAVLLFEGGDVKKWCIGAKPAYVIERELGLKKLGRAGGSTEGTGIVGALKRRWRR